MNVLNFTRLSAGVSVSRVRDYFDFHIDSAMHVPKIFLL